MGAMSVGAIVGLVLLGVVAGVAGMYLLFVITFMGMRW